MTERTILSPTALLLTAAVPAAAVTQQAGDERLLTELAAVEQAGFEGIHQGAPLAQTNVESSSLSVNRDGKWLELFDPRTVIPPPGQPSK